MRIWVDLANSPHVPLFRALIEQLHRLDHTCEITARDFAETVSLAKAAGLSPEVIGRHGGRSLSTKGTNLTSRALALAGWARARRFDLALSHNSYAQIVAARMLRLKTVTLMDFEYQPANHLAFRLSTRVVVPEAFPESQLLRFGARRSKVSRYAGTKEDIYLATFQIVQGFEHDLCKLGIEPDNVLVVMRPPALAALYHRFENEIFDQLVFKLNDHAGVQVILLPRNSGQREKYGTLSKRLIIPKESLDGPALIAASDLVISAGGTMNREAAALGVPAASVYAGRWAAVDEELVREGRLSRISSIQDFEKLILRKKGQLNPRRATSVRDEVIKLILK